MICKTSSSGLNNTSYFSSFRVGLSSSSAEFHPPGVLRFLSANTCLNSSFDAVDIGVEVQARRVGVGSQLCVFLPSLHSKNSNSLAGVNFYWENT